MDEVNMAVVDLDMHLTVSTPDPEIFVMAICGHLTLEVIQKNDIMTAEMIEAFMIINLPASISPNKCGTLCCMVDTGVSGYFMPPFEFQKMFPDCIDV